MLSQKASSKPGVTLLSLSLECPADLGVLVMQFPVPAEQVDGAALGYGHQPGTGVAGNPGFRPLLQGSDHRVLSEFLRQPDVTGVPGETGDEPC